MKYLHILCAVAIIGACTDEAPPEVEPVEVYSCSQGHLACGFVGDPCTVYPTTTQSTTATQRAVCAPGKMPLCELADCGLDPVAWAAAR